MKSSKTEILVPHVETYFRPISVALTLSTLRRKYILKTLFS